MDQKEPQPSGNKQRSTRHIIAALHIKNEKKVYNWSPQLLRQPYACIMSRADKSSYDFESAKKYNHLHRVSKNIWNKFKLLSIN